MAFNTNQNNECPNNNYNDTPKQPKEKYQIQYNFSTGSENECPSPFDHDNASMNFDSLSLNTQNTYQKFHNKHRKTTVNTEKSQYSTNASIDNNELVSQPNTHATQQSIMTLNTTNLPPTTPDAILVDNKNPKAQVSKYNKNTYYNNNDNGLDNIMDLQQPNVLQQTQANFFLQPGAANHGGSFRQTLNPAIYNAYRLSSTNQTRSPAPLPTNRGNKSPVVQVIETYYRVPTASSRAMKGKQERYDKTALYKTVCKKTELCTNWMLTGSCTYGNKCHFAHGVEDLKPRMRVENYKTQPCCDPAREGCRRCMYGRRCNYCHPGEAIRRPHPTPYYDKDYYHALKCDFGEDNEYPFGIYI